MKMGIIKHEFHAHLQKAAIVLIYQFSGSFGYQAGCTLTTYIYDNVILNGKTSYKNEFNYTNQ